MFDRENSLFQWSILDNDVKVYHNVETTVVGMHIQKSAKMKLDKGKNQWKEMLGNPRLQGTL